MAHPIEISRSVLRPIGRPILQIMREAPVWGSVGRDRGVSMFGRPTAPRVVFLPAYGRKGAALLRIYNIAKALKRMGWSVHLLPHTLKLEQRRRCLNAIDADVLVMQGSRHSLNRPEYYPGRKIVYDIDDADFHLPQVADATRAAVSQVAAVVAGSDYIANWCKSEGARDVTKIWTGTPVSTSCRPHHASRTLRVAWAQSQPEDYHKEREFVIEVMQRVAAFCPDLQLRLYDRKPGQTDELLRPFAEKGIKVEWAATCDYPDYLSSFDDVAVGLSPISTANEFSNGKSFGKILAYLDRKVPVIASDAGEHGQFFDKTNGVISNDQGIWVGSILKLLRDADLRQQIAENAFQHFLDQLTVDASARQLDRVLKSVIAIATPSGVAYDAA